MSDLLIISGLWALAVVLYYHGGKRIGYLKGYHDGLEQGGSDVLHLLKQSNDEMTK